ncbi:class I SAM-dependent methyltransferase [Bacillus sp. FJAT-26377]|nr:class I SAM-dependent methyltransferase [Bacillus sp. FJAT-26377]
MENQLFYNRNKSFFYTFSNGKLPIGLNEENRKTLKIKSNEINKFIGKTKVNFTYEKILKKICEKNIKLLTESNQYLYFDKEDYKNLQTIYDTLLEKIYILTQKTKIFDKDIDDLFDSHYKKLQEFLIQSNGVEIFKKYEEKPEIFPVKCAEYNPEFQIKLLNIDIFKIKEPVLDIGCGVEGNLVKFLRENGIEAYGIDRNLKGESYLFNKSWFEYKFKMNTWGTVISHMAFSNHFMHHHLRRDGDFKKYAQQYMKVLNSLKPEGCFIYGPSLSFIEDVLVMSNQPYSVDVGEHWTKITKVQ